MLPKEKNNSKNYSSNIRRLYEEIESECRASKRDPGDVLLIAASKYADASVVAEVAGLGVKDFGENRAEELVEKYKITGDSVNWHFIGHLQSRKVKLVVPLARYIHSVDSLRLAEKINSEAEKISKIQKILIEINITGEDTKFGIAPGQIWDFLQGVSLYKNISITGLMTMAPLTDDKALIRSTFSGLKKILADINKKYPFSGVKELSMGMSNDFKIAIEEGATMLRIGSLIFL